MSMKQTLWQLLVTNPLVQIAAIVTILVGLLSILKDIGKLTMGAWHQVTRLYYWNRDRTLYRHIEGFPSIEIS
jgi:Ni/Fe-hydrogenase subunit HybB-like protein